MRAGIDAAPICLRLDESDPDVTPRSSMDEHAADQRARDAESITLEEPS